jgi:hypothetical protein
MTRRLSARLRSSVAALAVAAPLVTLSGCMQMLLTGAFLFKGMETPAEFEELKGSKTAVVCRPLVELQYSSSDAADQVAREVGTMLRQRVKKIELVSPQKIEQWVDEHEWDNFDEVGRATKADFVVGIELEEFSLYQGQTIYQGRARVHMTVHDMKKNGDVVYEKALPSIVYPPSAGLPTSERTEEQFRREFTQVVADRIGRSFYSWDHRDDAAMDSRALD